MAVRRVSSNINIKSNCRARFPSTISDQHVKMYLPCLHDFARIALLNTLVKHNCLHTSPSRTILVLYIELRKNVPNGELIILYHTLIIPYFSCCNIISRSQHTSYLNCLFNKQKKAIIIIINSKFNALTNLLFQGPKCIKYT